MNPSPRRRRGLCRILENNMAQMMIVFVKVCPFCGATPKLFGGKQFTVVCEFNNCDVHPVVICATMDEAIGAWNKRWTDKTVQVQVKAT